jgi:hypothetical protein
MPSPIRAERPQIKTLDKLKAAHADPACVLFPKQTLSVRELTAGVPDSSSKEYTWLVLQAAREDLARALAARPRAGVLGALKLMLAVRFKLMRLRALSVLAAGQLADAGLRDEILGAADKPRG